MSRLSFLFVGMCVVGCNLWKKSGNDLPTYQKPISDVDTCVVQVDSALPSVYYINVFYTTCEPWPIDPTKIQTRHSLGTRLVERTDSSVVIRRNKWNTDSGWIYLDSVKYTYSDSNIITRVNVNPWYLGNDWQHKHDTSYLYFVDMMQFNYKGTSCSIRKYEGRSIFNSNFMVTTFISDQLGIFKEYCTESESLSIQIRSIRDTSIKSLNYESLIIAHLFVLFQNPSFHSRYDNGPIWLTWNSYLDSPYPKCNKNIWPYKYYPLVEYR